MPQANGTRVPFITRDDLDFGGQTTFEVQVRILTGTTGDFLVQGATKAGLFVFKQNHVANAEPISYSFSLPDLPIWITVSDNADLWRAGECLVQVRLLLNNTSLHQLAHGYLCAGRNIVWPQTMDENGTFEQGFIETVDGGNPTGNAEVSFEIPAHQRWKLLAFRAPLVTDANAATRRVHFQIKDTGGTTVLDIIAGSTHVASLTRNYSFVQLGGSPISSDDDDIVSILPINTIIPAGYTIATETSNLQATDAWGQVVLWAEKFLHFEDN